MSLAERAVATNRYLHRPVHELQSEKRVQEQSPSAVLGMTSLLK